MDERIEKLADVLTNYSVKINKGDHILLLFGVAARDLALACQKRILQKGAIPVLHVDVPGFNYQYYKYASDEIINAHPILLEQKYKLCNGAIRLYADENTKELSNIDPHKVAMRRKVLSPISDILIDKDNWVLFEYPTNGLAQDAEMSTEEFEDFVFNACLVDWEAEAQKQEKLKQLMDAGKQVRIVGKNTDLTFSIEGRQGIKCCGKRNMPDGEVFIAPVEDSTEGYIEYSFPAIYGGREVDGVFLRFKEGKVIEAKAKKNESFLKEMIAMDEGACKLGEFGFATNYNITKHVKQILFDEKIGGSIHLALGRAYKEGNGQNESALHWDMIKDLREEGEVYIDDQCLLRDGSPLWQQVPVKEE